ncbi:MAG: DUF1641 domain-containing protein [Glaciimonas sp.]|nr:DUF1641 domain-containing protein [Glaciimonas sp.]
MNTDSNTIIHDTPAALPPHAGDTTRGQLNDAALKGLEELISKLEPLLATRRLNRVVELLSVVADTVDMTDDYFVEKLSKVFEEGVGAAWAAGNAARMAGARLAQMQETPSLIGLLRIAREPDVRRGLAFMLATAGVLGKQLAYDPIDYTAD